MRRTVDGDVEEAAVDGGRRRRRSRGWWTVMKRQRTVDGDEAGESKRAPVDDPSERAPAKGGRGRSDGGGGGSGV